jgi:hypothetical protein
MEKTMRNVFKKGHYYKFNNGRAFYVYDVCKCSKCQERGLFEPIVYWLDDCNSGWNHDYITDYWYNALAEDIEIESDSKETWVVEYISHTIEKRKNELEMDIEKYLSSWR